MARFPRIAGVLLLISSIVAAGDAHVFHAITPDDFSGEMRDCEVRLVSSPQAVEEVRPCGMNVSLVSSEAEVWLEAAGLITPFLTAIKSSVGGEHRLPLAAAGNVVVEAETARRTELWHMERHEWDGRRMRAFRRTAPGGASGSLQLPVGRAVAVELDPQGNPVAIARHDVLTTRDLLRLRPALPAAGGDLVVVAERTESSAAAGSSRLVLAGEPPKPPDLALDSADRIVGIWYGLAPGKIVISMESDSVRIDPIPAVVRKGELTFAKAIATPLPNLDVLVTVRGTELDEEELVIRVQRPDGSVIRTAEVRAGSTVRLDSMPAEDLQVLLSFDRWRLSRSVKLAAGTDQLVHFELEPFVVNGTVTYGGKPIAAEVGFSARQLKATDQDGRYRIVLWRPGRYTLQARIAGRADVPPFLDTTIIDSSRTIDIDIPRARHEVRVAEADSGRPVPRAEITVTQLFEDPVVGRREIVSRLNADEQGRAHLPPLRNGKVHLRTSANGYSPGETDVLVSDGDEDVLIDVRLRRLDDSTTLRIVLPDGSAAAGAELLQVSATGQILYSASAGADGTIDVPRFHGEAMLVVRHARAGADVRFAASSGLGEVTWQLPRPAPPLVIRAVDAGGQPARSSPIFVWIAGHRIGGSALSFALRAAAATSVDGMWTGVNLPASSTKLLVVERSGAPAPPDVGALDSFAQTVSFPWGGLITVTAY